MQKEAKPQSLDILAFNRMSVALNNSLDVEMVYDQIIYHIGDLVPGRASGLLLIENGHVSMARFTSRTGETLATQTISLPLDQVAYLYDYMAAHQAMRVTAIPDAFPFDVLSWVQAWAIVPIHVNNYLFGFICIYDDDAHALQPVHLDFLQAFADQAAIAIKNAQTAGTLENFTLELKALYYATLTADNLDELGRQIAQAVIEEFGQSDCAVLLIDRQTDTITRLAHAGNYRDHMSASLTLEGPGLVPEALRQKHLIYVPDVTQDARYAPNIPQTRSELVVPLPGRENIIGVLDLQSAEVDAFSDHDRRKLMAFADRAGIAVDNVLLYETLRQYAIDREQQVIDRTAELNNAKERVETILNSTSDAIILTTIDGHIDQSNQAFYDLFGYFYDEEFNWSLSRLVIPEQQETLKDITQSVVSHRKSQRFEATAVRKDGTQFEADLMISPVYKRTQDEGSWGLVCSLRDISQRKQIEHELRAALDRERELNELKTRFVSTASHEFRTPLATIMATKNLLLNYWERMDEAKRFQQFEKIDNQINYMTQLMDGVLTLGRMDAGKQPVTLEPLELNIFFAELIEEFQATMPQHQVVSYCEGEPKPLEADRTLMRKIIINLLVNAAKYSESGSTITLGLCYRQHAVEVSVQDEGIGIPENDQKHLFEAFHRAENVGTTSGTGLGLAIVKNAVEAQHGTISVESKINQGTTFTIVFPILE